MELLERGQQRVTKMTEGMEPVSYEERLREGTANCEKKGSEENPPMCINI